MSETLLDESKVLVGSLTGPALLGEDRALLQLTIADGSDTAQLARDEVLKLSNVLEQWLYDQRGAPASQNEIDSPRGSS